MEKLALQLDETAEKKLTMEALEAEKAAKDGLKDVAAGVHALADKLKEDNNVQPRLSAVPATASKLLVPTTLVLIALLEASSHQAPTHAHRPVHIVSTATHSGDRSTFRAVQQ